MGWAQLIDKTTYWLKLRRKRKEGVKPSPAPVPPGPAMPIGVAWEKVCDFERESYKVSAIMPLDGGALVCSYNNSTRNDSRLFRCGADGTKKEIWHGGEETVGQGYKLEGRWYLPVEKPQGDILAVPVDGSSCKAFTAQGGRYACRIVEGCVGVGQQLFDVGTPSVPIATFTRLSGILCGLVHVGDEWIASDDERGIMSSKGWFIEAKCPDLAVVGGKVLAFLRSGDVRVIEGEKLGRSLGTTLHKCRRAWSDGKRCWWTTAPSDGGDGHAVWMTDGDSMLQVGCFAGKKEETPASSLGSLFGSAICEAADGTLWCAISNKTEDGWELYRGTPTYPAPEPEPSPTPDPEPEPVPNRMGEPSWKGTGAFNTYDEIQGTPSPENSVRVRAWVKANDWTGGGSEQAAGFCLANKGLVGSHWGFNLSIRPGGVVVNGTRGELVGPCVVSLGEWHFIDCTIEPRVVTCFLDGNLVRFGAPDFDLLGPSNEPLRIGGYHCPWPKATWFNQSINGEISDWQVDFSSPAPEPDPVPPPEEPVEVGKCAVWNEQSSADDYGMGGDVFARSGMVAGRTWRLLHGLYDEVPGDISAWVRSAMDEGAKGIAIDVEGPFNAPAPLRALRAACDAVGAKMVGAVKVSANPGGEYPGGDFPGSAKLCQEVFDAVLLWGYGCNGEQYEEWFIKWRSAGFFGQLGAFQDQVRDEGGYIGKEVWEDVARHAKAGWYPFVLFLPNHSSPEDLAKLREIFA